MGVLDYVSRIEALHQVMLTLMWALGSEIGLLLVPLVVELMKIVLKAIGRLLPRAARLVGSPAYAVAVFRRLTRYGEFLKENTKAWQSLIYRQAEHSERLMAKGKPPAHFLSRHGDHIPDELIRRRAKTGEFPDLPGEKGPIVDSTQFSSSIKETEAYDAAMKMWREDPKRGGYPLTQKDAGGGYRKGGTGPRTEAHYVFARIDRDGNMSTMYPTFELRP
jgi:hypothetical protein